MVLTRVRSGRMLRRDVDRLQGEIEELFADLWQVPRFAGLRHGFRPPVDCFHTSEPHQLTVVVELAGVAPETVEVVVEERGLIVSGERRRPRVDGQVYQQMEIEYGPFQRRIQLAEDVEVERASAAYDRGFLTVTLPIADRAPRPERVVIEIRRQT